MGAYLKVHDIMGKFMALPRDHVHAYVIELEKSVVVVDTTLAQSSAAEVRAKAESLNKPIEAVLLTHGHPDHYTGLVKFADLPRFASQGCLEFARREDLSKSAVAKGYLGDDYPDVRVFPDQIVHDGQVLILGGIPVTFTDLGPGESDADGMWSFVLDGVKHVFLGDAIANHCHCFMRDEHAFEWLKHSTGSSASSTSPPRSMSAMVLRPHRGRRSPGSGVTSRPSWKRSTAWRTVPSRSAARPRRRSSPRCRNICRGRRRCSCSTMSSMSRSRRSGSGKERCREPFLDKMRVTR